MAKSFRERSREEFVQENLTLDSVKIGSLQRIADAVEIMAKDRVQLERDLKWYKEAYARKSAIIKDLENQIKGLKSAKSRYKNQAKKLENDIKNEQI